MMWKNRVEPEAIDDNRAHAHYKNTEFYKNPPRGNQVFLADRQTDMTKLFAKSA
jgi:hypothetical protein